MKEPRLRSIGGCAKFGSANSNFEGYINCIFSYNNNLLKQQTFPMNSQAPKLKKGKMPFRKGFLHGKMKES